MGRKGTKSIKGMATVVAVFAAVSITAGRASAGIDDPTDKCLPLPVKTNNQTILGQEVPGVRDVVLCWKADHALAGEPQLRNYEGCGDPCFAIVVRDLKVAFNIQLSARYTLGGQPQGPIPVGASQTVEPLSGTHQCIYSYWEYYNPCKDGVSIPANLKAAPGTGKVQLSWSKSFAFGDSKVAGYEVLRSASGAEDSFLPIGTTTALSFTDLGLQSGETFWFSVVAFDDKGNRSGMADPVSVTVK